MTRQPAADALRTLVDMAVHDLVERTRCSVEDVTVVSAEPVTWPDRSLGCARQGMRYEQVPVDGALIVLRHDAVVYRYHSGGSHRPFLCTTTG